MSEAQQPSFANDVANDPDPVYPTPVDTSPQKEGEESLLAKFVRLSKEVKDAERAFDEIKAQYDELIPQIDDHMIRQGIENVRVNGVLIYRSTMYWANVPENLHDEGFKVIKDEGIGQYIAEKLNTQSFSAWVRERIKSEEGLPDSFVGVKAWLQSLYKKDSSLSQAIFAKDSPSEEVFGSNIESVRWLRNQLASNDMLNSEMIQRIPSWVMEHVDSEVDVEIESPIRVTKTVTIKTKKG